MRRIFFAPVWAMVFCLSAFWVVGEMASALAAVQHPERFPDVTVPAMEGAREQAMPFVLVGATVLAGLGAWYRVLPGTGAEGRVDANDPGRQDRRLERLLGALAAALLIGFFAVVALLHLLRLDYDPRSGPLSGYVLGPFGELMTAAFWLAGSSCVVLALGLLRDVAWSFWLLVACVGLLLAGIGNCLTGVCPADFIATSDGLRWTPTGILHGYFAMWSSMVAMGVFITLPWALRRCRRWRSFFWPSLAVALVNVALFFLVPQFPPGYAGLGQRLAVGTMAVCALLIAARLWWNEPTPQLITAASKS